MSLRDSWFASPSLMVAPDAASTITPGASPYVYTAASPGVMYVSGGTVTLMQVVRKGVTTGVGLIAGAFYLRSGDQLLTTYAVAPTMIWMPA